ncbi:MAG: hypothetical protein Q9227_000394 [Pyrenula ochraceoflavens]
MGGLLRYLPWALYTATQITAYPAAEPRQAPPVTASSLPACVTPIWQFQPGTWLENLAVRSSGQILVNDLAAPSMYQLDPTPGTPPVLAANISGPSITGLLGIAEVAPDMFWVIAGGFDLHTLSGKPGTFSIWKVDLSTFDTSKPGSAAVSKIADAPSAGLLNGLAALPNYPGGGRATLASDSTNGQIWRIKADGGVEVVIDNQLLKGSAGASSTLGVNGIQIQDGYLYFVNYGAGTFGRFPINADGSPAGQGEVLETNPSHTGWDDFTLDANGDAFVAENPGNYIGEIKAGISSATVVAGGVNATDVLGPTAAKFGRSSEDKVKGSLYITTTGGAEQYTTKATIGGGLYRVDLGASIA